MKFPMKLNQGISSENDKMSFSSMHNLMAFGNSESKVENSNEKVLASPELCLLTPETAMRDAGIRKFVNPYGK